MTRDEMVAIYKQVADEIVGGTEWAWHGVDVRAPVCRFAELIAAAEREACANILAAKITRYEQIAREAHRQLVTEDYPGHTAQLDPWTIRLLERFAALVAAAEREECARVVEEPWQGSPKEIAAQIRARGKE